MAVRCGGWCVPRGVLSRYPDSTTPCSTHDETQTTPLTLADPPGDDQPGAPDFGRSAPCGQSSPSGQSDQSDQSDQLVRSYVLARSGLPPTVAGARR